MRISSAAKFGRVEPLISCLMRLCLRLPLSLILFAVVGLLLSACMSRPLTDQEISEDTLQNLKVDEALVLVRMHLKGSAASAMLFENVGPEAGPPPALKTAAVTCPLLTCPLWPYQSNGGSPG